MTQHERDAVIALGYSEATWTDPELFQESADPFLIGWDDLSQSQQAAALVLGYSQSEWDPDNDHEPEETA